MRLEDIKIGDAVAYVPSAYSDSPVDYGLVSSIKEDRVFVRYHSGSTGALTPVDRLHSLYNFPEDVEAMAKKMGIEDTDVVAFIKEKCNPKAVELYFAD